jgi:hypothetical protein
MTINGFRRWLKTKIVVFDDDTDVGGKDRQPSWSMCS